MDCNRWLEPSVQGRLQEGASRDSHSHSKLPAEAERRQAMDDQKGEAASGRTRSLSCHNEEKTVLKENANNFTS